MSSISNDMLEKRLKKWKPIIGGFAASYFESWLDYGFIGAKIMRQNKIPFPKNPIGFYRGITAFQTSLLPSTIIQAKVNSFYENVKKEKHQFDFSCFIPFVGGAIGALIATPIENIIQTQQKYKIGPSAAFSYLIKEHGICRLGTGLLPTTLREGGFSWGIWYGCAMFSNLFSNSVDNKKSEFKGAVLSGTLAAFFTHPPDVIANQMRTYNKAPSVLSVTKKIYSDHGLKGFFPGFFLRTCSVIGANYWFPKFYNDINSKLERSFEHKPKNF